MARPPLLCQGGEFHSDASRHFRFIVFSPTRLFCLPRSGGLNLGVSLCRAHASRRPKRGLKPATIYLIRKTRLKQITASCPPFAPAVPGKDNAGDSAAKTRG